jgi:protein SCO1/2
MNPFATRVAMATCIGLALVPSAGCRRHPPRAAQPPALSSGAEAGRAITTYRLVGVVRRVQPETGVVTIRHEAIPGFMDAMTMPFTLSDRAPLADLHPGDEVEGSLRVERERGQVTDSTVTDLVVTRPAAAPGLTLDLSGGEPRLRPAPRVLEPGQEVPDFTLTTQDGRTLKLSELRGAVVVLTFIYTRCPLPDFCPLMDRKFAELAGTIGAFPARAARVRLLSVSFDPEHDTPEVLRRHAESRGARPPLWTFAVAAHAELAKVAGSLGLAYGPGRDEIIHNLATAVIDPRGRLARLEIGSAGKNWKPLELLKTIYSLIPASGE